MAIVADRVAENTYVTGRAMGSRGLRKPRPIERPGDDNRGRLGNRGDHDTEDVVAYLDQFRPTAA